MCVSRLPQRLKSMFFKFLLHFAGHSPLSGRVAQREKKINQFGLWEMFWGYFCDSKLPRMKFNNQPFLRCQLAHTAHSAKFGRFFCLCTQRWLVVKFHPGQFWVTEMSPKHFPKAELVDLFFPLSNPSRKGWSSFDIGECIPYSALRLVLGISKKN